MHDFDYLLSVADKVCHGLKSVHVQICGFIYLLCIYLYQQKLPCKSHDLTLLYLSAEK